MTPADIEALATMAATAGAQKLETLVKSSATATSGTAAAMVTSLAEMLPNLAPAVIAFLVDEYRSIAVKLRPDLYPVDVSVSVIEREDTR